MITGTITGTILAEPSSAQIIDGLRTGSIQVIGAFPINTDNPTEKDALVLGYLAVNVHDPHNGFVSRTVGIIGSLALLDEINRLKEVESDNQRMQAELRATSEKMAELWRKLVEVTRDSQTWSEIAEEYGQYAEKLQRLLDRRFNGYGGWSSGGSLGK